MPLVKVEDRSPSASKEMECPVCDGGVNEELSTMQRTIQ
jgi:hypothetical protein